MAPSPHPHDLHDQRSVLLSWFALNYRDLPWRKTPDSSDNRNDQGGKNNAPAACDSSLETHPPAWGVLVSEVMLQQTPVARVDPMWREWMSRWPTPGDLAQASPAEVIKAWGRLGYPRRALRLQAAAAAIVERHDGRVPADFEALRALPGVGDYTAGAVLAFAFGQPHLALDVNVRRVLARHDAGRARPTGSVTAAERDRAQQLLPDGAEGARWMAAIMELGALVCTAQAPRCGQCPVASGCRWAQAGYPENANPPRRQPTYVGSDRQARGAILAVLREAETPVDRRRLEVAWPEAAQRDRALDSLIADGLVEPLPRGRYRLPIGTLRSG